MRRLDHLQYIIPLFEFHKADIDLRIVVDKAFKSIGQIEANRYLSSYGFKNYSVEYSEGVVSKKIKNLLGVLSYLAETPMEHGYFFRHLRRTFPFIYKSKVGTVICRIPYREYIFRLLVKTLRGVGYLYYRKKLEDFGKQLTIDENCDLIIATPGNMHDSFEDDLIGLAKVLKIKSVGLFLSLDNANSKGSIFFIPDVYLCWNEFHKEKAIRRHQVENRFLRVTGSPYFEEYRIDSYLVNGKTEIVEKTRISKRMRKDKKEIVYLGSSANIGIREDVFVESFFGKEFLERSDIVFKIRPHPANTKIWEPLMRRGVQVLPIESTLLGRNIENELSIFQSSDLVLGVNTSALLNAVCLGAKVVAVEWKSSLYQHNSSHFEFLMQSGLPIVRDLSELSKILESVDESAESSLLFVKNRALPYHGNVSRHFWTQIWKSL